MRAALLALSLLLAGSFAGCLKEIHEPNVLRIAGIDVAAPRVGSGTVTLTVNTTLDNAGGPSGALHVVAKAFDLATGLLAASNDARLGPIPKDKSVPVPIDLEVPRKSGYRVEVVVLQNDKLAQTGSVTANNVAALQPNVFDRGLRIGTLDFLVNNVTGNRVVIAAAVPVSNEGREGPRDLRIQVKAREVTTGLVSDEAWAPVPGVAPGETRTAEVRLDVASGYNYEIEAVLWEANTTIERGHGNVQLLPTFTKDKAQELVVSRPEISDFVRREEAPAQAARTPSVPGPDLVIVVAFVAGAALVSRRLGRRN